MFAVLLGTLCQSDVVVRLGQVGGLWAQASAYVEVDVVCDCDWESGGCGGDGTCIGGTEIVVVHG